ncbi:MAG: dicarboxylate/amino acid:cation symporter [Gemmatimonadaceae bacterium]
MNLATKVSIALVAGLAVGIAIASSVHPVVKSIPGFVEPIGTLWVNALRMTVIPLVVSAILVGVTSLPDSRSVGRLGSRALVFFGIVLLIAATVSTFAGHAALSQLTIDPVAATALRASAEQATGAAVASATKIPTFAQWMVDLIPSNPIKSAADGAMLPLIVFTLLFGVAITQLNEVSRASLVSFVRAINEASQTLVRWILIAAPIGVFCISVPLATKLGVASVGAVAYYIAIIVALNILFTAALYVAAAVIGRQPLRLFARAAAPSQAVAFSTRSSLASLPAMMEGAKDVLQIPVAVRSFVLPFAVAMFRCGGAIALPIGVVFAAKLFGIELHTQELVTIVLTSVVTTLSAPGIPGGSIIVMVPVLLAVGLPVGAIGLLLGVDTIPDMFRTVTNVTADLAATTILNRFERTAQPHS